MFSFLGYLKNVASDMKTLRPTILPAVPRFLNRIYKECVATANKTSFFRQVFNLGLQLKTDELYRGIVRRDSVWDKLLFWFVRQKVGLLYFHSLISIKSNCFKNLIQIMRRLEAT